MAILRFSKWRPSAMLDFKNLQFLSRSPCRPAVLLPHTKFCWNRTIGRWFMAKKAIFKMAAATILNFKNVKFWHVTVNGFNIWCSVPNFIKIWQFFTEIWRFYDFQNGGRPPCWMLKILQFLSYNPRRHAVLLPRTKFRCNRTIGRWVMAKKSIYISTSL